MKSCIPILIFSLICCQKLRLKNIIFLNHHFCVNNRNRIRRIATESELLQNGGGKKKGTRILPLYYGNHSSTNDDLLSTTIPTRGKLRHSLVIIQTFTLLIEFDYSSMRPPIRFDWWISFTDFSCFFFLYSFSKARNTRKTKQSRVVVASSKDDARMITTTTWRRLLSGEFSGGEKRKSLRRGRRERHKRREGVKGIVSECSYTRARIQTRVSIFASAISAQPAGLDTTVFLDRCSTRVLYSSGLFFFQPAKPDAWLVSSSLKRVRSCFPSNNQHQLYPIFLAHTHIRYIRSRVSNYRFLSH